MCSSPGSVDRDTHLEDDTPKVKYQQRDLELCQAAADAFERAEGAFGVFFKCVSKTEAATIRQIMGELFSEIPVTCSRMQTRPRRLLLDVETNLNANDIRQRDKERAGAQAAQDLSALWGLQEKPIVQQRSSSVIHRKLKRW